MNICAELVLKIIHLLIGSHLLLVPNLLCMQEHQDGFSLCDKQEQHCDEWAHSDSPPDLNRLGQLNQLSLQAKKLHLMALLISKGQLCGLFPTSSDSSCLTQMIDIKHLRKEINLCIAQIMKCADRPAALEYILKHDKVFGKFAALDLRWRKNKKKIKAWFFKIPLAYSIESCQQLEHEFFVMYEGLINSFYDLFSGLKMVVDQYYGFVLRIM